MRASPDCSSSSSSSSKLAGFSPSARPAAGAPGGTGGSRAAQSWAGSPAAMDSDDEMVEEAVEGTSISLGPGEEAPGLGTRKEWRVTRAAPGPTAATVPYVGGPLPGSVRGRTTAATPPGARTARWGAGREPGSAEPGLPGEHGCSIPPATACILSSELRTLLRTLAFPLSGMEGGGAQEDSPLRPAVSAEQCPRPVWRPRAPLRPPALSFRSPLRAAAIATATASGWVPGAAHGAEPGTWQPRPGWLLF